MSMPLRVSFVFALGVMLLHSGTARAACENLVPEAAQSPTSRARPVTAEDLASLRDIGQPDAALSPPESPPAVDRKRGAKGKSVTERRELGGSRHIKKKKKRNN